MLLVLAVPEQSPAANAAKDRYFQADACYKTVRNSPTKQKYRDNWLGCIRKYQSVYDKDPSGPWAAAGLYMAGNLYQQLYHHSRRKDDNRKAIERYRRVIAEFPDSAYRQKAAKNLARALLDTPEERPQAKTGTGTPEPVKASATVKADAARDEASRKRFIAASTCYQELQVSPRLQKYRERWLGCIGKYEQVFENDPSGPWAAAGLYNAGKLYLGMYAKSYRRADKDAAVEKFNRVVAGYPHSRYHEKSIAALAEMGLQPKKAPAVAAKKNAKADPDGKTGAGRGKADSTPDAVADIIQSASRASKTSSGDAAPSGGPVTVKGLRFWSNPNYTRVVIDAGAQAKFSHHLLREDPSLKKPMRLFVDLENSRLGNGINQVVPINDNLLSDARAGQFTTNTVRVVVDIKSIRTYKIFSLRNPFRIVIDLWGKDSGEASASRQKTVPQGSAKEKIPPGSLARQLALGVSRIVIDPGHGGKDPGATGYLKGVYEKKVTLQIARRLSKKIREKLKCEVILTRTGDTFLSLEERTAIANTRNADLFISIHANSTRDRRAYGLETYFLNLATDEEAIRVAATENATSTKNISDLQTILSDLMQNAKINESSRLAQRVQDAMVARLKKNYKYVKNKGVKQAPFYVLLGAQMPAILIETSFISNSRECKRLVDARYQERLCDGILEGITRYIRETNPTALLNTPAGSS